jgi:anti-anti-sigma factor
MPTTQLQIDCVEAPDSVLLYLRGELDLASVGRLRSVLGALGAGRRGLIVDLSGLEFMDSTGLAVLLEAQARRHRDGGGGLRVRAAAGRVRALLERTGTLRVLDPESAGQPELEGTA